MKTASRDEHPAEYLAPSIAELQRRAKFAIAALGAVIVARVWDLGVREWSVALLEALPAAGNAARLPLADALVNAGNIALVLTFLVTAAFFLRWVHRLVDLVRVLGGEVRWGPSQAVWGFVIPFVNLFRPYQVLYATYAALDPRRLRAAPPRVDPASQGDYRSVAFALPAPARKLPVALVGPWWIAFLAMCVANRLTTLGETPTTVDDVIAAYQHGMIASGIAILAAALGITVVRGLTARAVERFQRLQERSPESIADRGLLR